LPLQCLAVVVAESAIVNAANVTDTTGAEAVIGRMQCRTEVRRFFPQVAGIELQFDFQVCGCVRDENQEHTARENKNGCGHINSAKQ